MQSLQIHLRKRLEDRGTERKGRLSISVDPILLLPRTTETQNKKRPFPPSAQRVSKSLTAQHTNHPIIGLQLHQLNSHHDHQHPQTKNENHRTLLHRSKDIPSKHHPQANQSKGSQILHPARRFYRSIPITPQHERSLIKKRPQWIIPLILAHTRPHPEKHRPRLTPRHCNRTARTNNPRYQLPPHPGLTNRTTVDRSGRHLQLCRHSPRSRRSMDSTRKRSE